VWSSTDRVARGEPLTIGRPIANTAMYVLDRRGEPTPIGVSGELHIGGDAVVRGYLGRDALTAERFVPDPFRGGRMYRTGDRARFREDGRIDFLGRLDHQVKIRGHRIELGEIEALLARHEAVSEAVVVAREDHLGDQRLVAYVIAKRVPAEVLKTHLRQSLPEFMVPSHLVFLDSFPKTPNGKIDRKALPSPARLSSIPVASFAAPSTGLEAKIGAIWEKVLGKERVSIDDNFFDIGGHSLLVVRVHGELKGAVERPVSLTDLYRFPTIRALAGHLAAEGDDGAHDESADRGARRRELFSRRRRR